MGHGPINIINSKNWCWFDSVIMLMPSIIMAIYSGFSHWKWWFSIDSINTRDNINVQPFEGSKYAPSGTTCLTQGPRAPISRWLESWLPSGKRLRNYGKSPFSMGKSTISMAIFNSYVSLPEGIHHMPMCCLPLKGFFTFDFLIQEKKPSDTPRWKNGANLCQSGWKTLKNTQIPKHPKTVN